MSTVYKFKDSLEDGEKHEKVLDDYYSQWFYIQPVSFAAQKSGIDRTWTNISDNFRYSVEYKADSTAANTGNAFIETISVDTTNTMGWAYTSCSQLMIYYIPPLKKAYRCAILSLKHLLRGWIKKYGTVSIPNEGYNTIGIIVPLEEFQNCSYYMDYIDLEENNGYNKKEP